MIRLTTASGGVYEVDLDGHRVRKVQTTSESLVNSFPWIAYFRLLGRQDADSFKIHRDIVVQNGITGAVLYQISGLCSLGNNDGGKKHTVTCKIGEDTYVKELLWIGDQDEVLSVQSRPSYSDPFAYRIVVKPQTLDLQLQTAMGPK